MSNLVTCTDCGRTPNDWIDIKGTLWEPDFEEVRPNVWTCFACRGEPHKDMSDKYIQRVKS